MHRNKHVKLIKRINYAFLLSVGFLLMPAFVNTFAEEIEPPVSTEEPVVEVQEEAVPEEESTQPEEDPTSPAGGGVEPEPEEVLDGWQNNNTQYYQDGVAVDGVTTIDGNVYYFKDTVLNQYTGFVKNNEQNNWVFVRNGKSDWSFTGVAKSIANNEWYHAKNGILDWNFTGFSKSVENGKWYVSYKGKLNWNYTGVAKSIANGEWYHAKNGRLDWSFIGFSKSYLTNKWYVSYKGKLNWNYTGVAKSIANGEWYHAKNGRLDWGFTGLSKSYLTKKYYYSRNGKLDWNYHGKAKNIDNKKIYYVSNGRQVNDQRMIHIAQILESVRFSLRGGYDWIIQNITYRSMEEDPNLGSAWFGEHGYKNHWGNCFVYAGLMTQMAKFLGYNVQQVYGYHLSKTGREQLHSWVEIQYNGTKIIDPDFEYELKKSGWMQTYDAPILTYKSGSIKAMKG